MSWIALGWAASSKVIRSADKLVLLGLADRHNTEHELAYPSLAWLCEFSSLDRKTVVTALDRLERYGFITDSGQRVGKTKQVKAYRLNINSAENGTVKTEPLGGKSAVFSGKQSQKRDEEPVIEPTEAKASYRQVEELWNSLSPVSKIPEIRVWNNSRKQMCNARVREHGLDAILEGVRKIHRSPFCRGQLGDGRKQDVMLLLQPKTCARVLEGFYGEDGERARPKSVDEQIAHYRELIPFYEKIGRDDDAAECRRKIASLERPADPVMAANVASVVREVGSAAKNFSGRVAAR